MVTHMEQKTMKLCKDCTWFVPPGGSLNVVEYGRCNWGMTANPVTGSFDVPVQSSKYAIACRTTSVMSDKNCGLEARYFEPARQAVSA